MKKCHCGVDNDDAAQSCSECGLSLAEQVQTTPLASEGIITSELERCDPVVQKYVETLKADNLKLKRQLAKFEKLMQIAKMIAVLFLLIGFIIFIPIIMELVMEGSRFGD